VGRLSRLHVAGQLCLHRPHPRRRCRRLLLAAFCVVGLFAATHGVCLLLDWLHTSVLVVVVSVAAAVVGVGVCRSLCCLSSMVRVVVRVACRATAFFFAADSSGPCDQQDRPTALHSNEKQ
jgi:hypothetical protein